MPDVLGEHKIYANFDITLFLALSVNGPETYARNHYSFSAFECHKISNTGELLFTYYNIEQ